MSLTISGSSLFWGENLSAFGIEALAEGSGVFAESARLIFIEDSASAFIFSAGSFLGPINGFGAGIMMRNTNRFTSLGSNLGLELKIFEEIDS